jgi:aminotransferase in exopolysaccharide biosynthesis
MKNCFANIIINSIKKVIGEGPHQLHEPLFIGNEINYLQKTIKENFVSTSGKYVKKFERNIKKITKAKFAIAVVNGTEALHIALKVCGVKNGDEVLVPALTFVGTVNAIVHSGGEPHFIDSDIETLGVDYLKLNNYLNKIAIFSNGKTINKFTKKVIRAIVPVHIFGHACKINEINKLAKKFNLLVIEDAAEAFGSFYMNKHLGTFGAAGCLSFNGNKIITTGGGGAIITNNSNFAKRIRHLTTTAKLKHKWEFIHDEVGYNLRMPNLNAALGLAQIENLNKFIKAKRTLYKKYKKIFDNVKGVTLFKESLNTKSNYWLQTLILDKENIKFKNKILKLAHRESIFIRPAWKIASDLKPYKKKLKMNLSGAKDIYDRVLNIPSGQDLIL